VRYAKFVSLIGVVPLLVGVPLYWLSSLVKKAAPSRTEEPN
jgi:hypothetical protein